MPLLLDQFVKNLEDSGIISPSKLRAVREKLPTGKEQDVQELAKELVRQKKLTKFQAQEAYNGKAKNLVLGNYILLDRIGAGGMGQVYQAQHKVMERIVAVKVLPPAVTKDPAAVQRFHREVKAAAKLSHPNIVTAYDADQAGGIHFLVMEFVEGSDLSALVKKRGPLSVAQTVDYLLQAAKGLEFAHKKGVVHRDIKPANLLLDTEGTVKILDMGLARIDADGHATTQAELTGTGMVMGTVDYMAPEQAISTRTADHRADIYSLGCTCYYLLTGKPLYEGETITAKLIAHQSQAVPELPVTQARSASEGVEVGGRKSEIGSHQPDAPARDSALTQLNTVFQKMVAKTVDDRYQSMTEVIAALEQCRSGSSSSLSVPDVKPSGDTGLLTFLRELPGKSTKKSGVAGGQGVAGVAAAATPAGGARGGREPFSAKRLSTGDAGRPKKAPDPVRAKLFLYGSLAGGVLALLGIPIVLYFALSGGSKPAPSVNPQSAIHNPQLPAGFALDFDGKQSYVATPIFYDASHPITVEAYATTRTLKGHQNILSDTETTGIGLYQKGGFWNWDVNLASSALKSTSGVTPHKRVHLAGVWDGKEARIYLDGQLQQAASAPLLKRSKIPLLIGANPHNANSVAPYFQSTKGHFDGLIDEVRISKTARYTGNFTPKPRHESDADTLALYHFDDGTGEIASDASPNKNHARIFGAKWVHADGSAIGSGTSAGLSGSGDLFMHDPAFGQWLKDVQTMSAAQQIEAVRQKMVDVNPMFEGQLRGGDWAEVPTIENDVVTKVSFSTEHVRDLSPIRAFSKLTHLECSFRSGGGKVSNLAPLEGLRLTYLNCSSNPVGDLTPLQGMPLETLFLNSSRDVTNLAPVKELPLTRLDIRGTRVSDVSPLMACKSLQSINMQGLKLPAAQVAALRLALPNCKIDWEEPAGASPSAITAADPDRAVAEWVVKGSGQFSVASGASGRPVFLSQAPSGSFRLQVISLGSHVTDAEISAAMPQLRSLRELANVGLSGNKAVTLASLQAMATLPHVTVLSLSGTSFRREDFLALETMPQLQSLSVGTGNTTDDSDLESISRLKQLRRLSIESSKLTDRGVELVAGLSNLERLTIKNAGQFTAVGIRHLRNCSQLEEVTFQSVSLGDDCASPLAELPKLRTLVLFGTALSDTGLADLAAAKGLASLDIRQTSVTPAGVAALKKALPNCQISADIPANPAAATDLDRRAALWALEKGEMVFVAEQGKLAVQILSADQLPAGPFQLQRLGMTGARVPDADYANLAGLVELRDLYLGNTQITIAALRAIGPLPKLVGLEVYGTKLDDAGLAYIADTWPKLTNLNLNSTLITGGGLSQVARLPGLEYLYLRKVKLSSADLAHLASLTKLRQLELRETPIGDEGLVHLAKLRSLTQLNLEQTSVTAAGVSNLKKALPGCFIAWNDPAKPASPAPTSP